MRAFLYLLVFFTLPIPSFARWEVQSDFQLHLSESLFDKLVGDFWQSLQGTQQVDIGSTTIHPSGIPVHINGIKAELDYSFPLPTRTGAGREWQLETSDLGAKITVDNISATQVIRKEIDGTIIEIEVKAECNNIVLSLPKGNSSVQAKIRAELVNNQVKLSFNDLIADWQEGSWQVDSISCTGIEGLKQIVEAESLKELQSFQNFDSEIRNELAKKFTEWSNDASLILLSEKELPTGKDYLKVYYEPSFAEENAEGILLKGLLRFDYPYIAEGQEIIHSYQLQNPDAVKSNDSVDPMLVIPFGAVRSLMMGEYFAGKLEYSLKAKEIPAFTELMQSRFSQFFAWPDLMRYAKDTQFAFQFLPMGPPSFDQEHSNTDNSISGELNLPLAVRMFAPINGVYTPYVEFRSMLSGSANLNLVEGGMINFQLSTDELPLSYAWSQKYLADYRPSTRIAVSTISKGIKESLEKEGFTLSIPIFTVGKSMELVPKSWKLDGGNLRLHFNTN